MRTAFQFLKHRPRGLKHLKNAPEPTSEAQKPAESKGTGHEVRKVTPLRFKSRTCGSAPPF